jgi:hypothetical protein
MRYSVSKFCVSFTCRCTKQDQFDIFKIVVSNASRADEIAILKLITPRKSLELVVIKVSKTFISEQSFFYECVHGI